MYKQFSGTLPINCMGIRFGNPLALKNTWDPDPASRHFIPEWVQVQDFCYPLEAAKPTDPDWAIRGRLQPMTWPQKPIFWIDEDGPDILWVNAHPSEGDCGGDFKFTSFKWIYGYQDIYRTYLIQVTSGDAFSRRFPHLTNIITLPRREDSLEDCEIYF